MDPKYRASVVCSSCELFLSDHLHSNVELLPQPQVKKDELSSSSTQWITFQGPLINKRQFERVVSLVDSAKKSGVKIVTGMISFLNKLVGGCVYNTELT